MTSPQLELQWIGKHRRNIPLPMVLAEDPSRSRIHPNGDFTSSHEEIYSDNRLIHGDNLPALQALTPEFAERIKLIYIDPPYNTGSSFGHYFDDREHAQWLSFMRDRLELLRNLLRPDGILFVSIDDNELAYLSVLLDEIFGRNNGCGHFVWEKKKKPSFLDANMGKVTEYILAYAKDRTHSPAFIGGATTFRKKYPLNNAGNGRKTLTFPANSVIFQCPDQIIEPRDMSSGNIVTVLLDPVDVRNGRNASAFRLEGEWRYSQSTLDALIAAGETLIINKAPFRPNHIKTGGEPKKLKNLLSVHHNQMSTYEDAALESRALFGDPSAFPYPKPEKLIATLINAVTEPGDWVLDCFAGSGTTGAVAHKLRRPWIMVELGAHCRTHIIPRITQVINGADPGGITADAQWHSGGGFRFFTLQPAPAPWIGHAENAELLTVADLSATADKSSCMLTET